MVGTGDGNNFPGVIRLPPSRKLALLSFPKSSDIGNQLMNSSPLTCRAKMTSDDLSSSPPRASPEQRRVRTIAGNDICGEDLVVAR